MALIENAIFDRDGEIALDMLNKNEKQLKGGAEDEN